MSGKFSFPSIKEAKALSEGALSLSQKKTEEKRKKTLLDTFEVDDRPATKSSAVDPSVVLAVTCTGTPPVGA